MSDIPMPYPAREAADRVAVDAIHAIWPLSPRAAFNHPVCGDIRGGGRVLHVVRDQIIYSDGDAADHVFRVETGVVRSCKFLRDGRRHVDAFHGPGDVFGLEVGPRYTLSAEAASPCAITSYRRLNLETLAATNDRLSLELFASALSSLARSQGHSLSLGRRSAIERVALFLMGCAEYAPGSEDIALEMTRKDIADYLGLTIETVSRAFSQLECQDFIQLTGARQVHLRDCAGLRNLCA